ncbi:MAG: bifunctional sugar-1-phosphate nucleotidylyltransferase/acetyltransferase [Patescibacteria group bacterium]
MKAIVLAAGENSRFWPFGRDRHKCMYEVGTGKPVLFYTLQEIADADLKEVIMIVRENDIAIENYCKSYAPKGLEISFLYQTKPLGMGDALLSASEFLGDDEHFIVLNPNNINSASIIKRVIDKKNSVDKTGLVLVTQKTNSPHKFGIVEVSDDRVLSIEEKPELPKSDLRVVGVYCLSKKFIEYLKKFDGEYSLESALQKFILDGNKVYHVEITRDHYLPSLKYPWDLLSINRFLLERDAVSNDDRHGLYKTQGVIIEGQVVLGNRVRFLGRASIKGPCCIGNDVVIGDDSVIRDHSFIGNNCVIGCRTEIKNSILGSGVHTHYNFIGDSIIGDNCRLGAGTMIANRRVDRKIIKSLIKGKKIETGSVSLGVMMGLETKTGINVSIMPGIKIGNNCIIGPQTLVNEDVEDNQICYSVGSVSKKVRL